MPKEISLELPMASGFLLTNVPGGQPVTYNGVTVGGIGIAGGTVEQDAQIAKAIISDLQADAT